MAYKKPILIVDLKGSLKTPLLDFKICLNIELSRSLGVTLTLLYLGPFFKNLSSLMFMLYMIKKLWCPLRVIPMSLELGLILKNI